MKLIQFKDKTYGIRTGWFKLTYRYLDIHSPAGFLWHRETDVNKWCKGTKEQAEIALAFYKNKRDYGKIV